MPISPIEVAFSHLLNSGIQMFNFFKRFTKLFSKPTVDDLITEARISYTKMFLQEQEAAARSAKMAEFYKEGLDRMTSFTHLGD